MSSPLPDLLDPWRSVDNRAVFAGRLPLSSLSRLRSALLDSEGDVAFRLAFERDQEDRAVMHGEARAALTLRCERCLGAFEHEVDTQMDLALVAGIDEARQLPDCYDPLVVSEKLIRPRDLIEDELLLGLPQIPAHPADVCGPPDDTAAGQPVKQRENPFAVLAQWKREKTNSETGR